MKWLCKKTGFFFSLMLMSILAKGNSLQVPKIKVLIGEFNPTEKQIFNIQSEKEFLLQLHYNHKTTRFLLRSNKLQILLKNKALYARGKKGPLKKIDAIEIRPTATEGYAKTIQINKKPYHGMLTFQFCPKTEKFLLINTLNLEDYVYAVLLAESYQTWPHEMQKIQAIVSRTYAVHQMLNHSSKRPYHIKCNNFHQRYTGKHSYHHLRQAVDETKNLILTYNSKVVLAMFDACCGGSIPANMTSIDFSKAPYLARTTACYFCKNYKLYQWKRKISEDQFLKHLRTYPPLTNKLRTMKNLTNIAVTERDQAGIVHTIQLTFPQANIMISGNDLWRSMNNDVRSQNFSITYENRSQKKYILIEGNGFGHQIGLCQRGARELVRRQWPLKKILNFYYSETKLARLKVVTPGKTHANV